MLGGFAAVADHFNRLQVTLRANKTIEWKFEEMKPNKNCQLVNYHCSAVLVTVDRSVPWDTYCIPDMLTMHTLTVILFTFYNVVCCG